MEDGTSSGESTHDLLLALAGRVDDDLLGRARELVAVGEDARAVELVTASLVACRAVLPHHVRAVLVKAARTARIELNPAVALPRPRPEDGTEHRFAAPPDDDPVAGALLALPPRALAGCRVLLARRRTPAGSAPGPVPHAVVLVEAPAVGRPIEVLAYQIAVALERAEVHASVEVLPAGTVPSQYHAAALRSAAPVISADEYAAPVERVRPRHEIEPEPAAESEPAPEPAEPERPEPEYRESGYTEPAYEATPPAARRRVPDTASLLGAPLQSDGLLGGLLPGIRRADPEPAAAAGDSTEDAGRTDDVRAEHVPAGDDPAPGDPADEASADDLPADEAPSADAAEENGPADDETADRYTDDDGAPGDHAGDDHGAHDTAAHDTAADDTVGDDTATPGLITSDLPTGAALPDPRYGRDPDPALEAPEPAASRPRPVPVREEPPSSRPAPRPVPAPMARPRRPTLTPISRTPVPNPIPLVRRTGPTPIVRPLRATEPERTPEQMADPPAAEVTEAPARDDSPRRTQRSGEGESPAFDSLNDPFNGPLNQPLLDPLLDPTIREDDPLGVGSRLPADDLPPPQAADDDEWSADWLSGTWAMAPSALERERRKRDPEPDAEPVERDRAVERDGLAEQAAPRPAPRRAARHRYADEPEGTSPDPEPAEEPAARARREPEPEPETEPELQSTPEPEPRQERPELGLRPESLARLSDADRKLLARLQAELLEGRNPRLSRRAGFGNNGSPTNGGASNGNRRSGPPDFAG